MFDVIAQYEYAVYLEKHLFKLKLAIKIYANILGWYLTRTIELKIYIHTQYRRRTEVRVTAKLDNQRDIKNFNNIKNENRMGKMNDKWFNILK